MRAVNIRDFYDEVPKESFVHTSRINFVESIEEVFENGIPTGLTISRYPDRVQVTFTVDYNPVEKRKVSLGNDQLPDKRLEHQLEALSWLQGKTSNEFVLGWIAMHKESLERAGGTPERG